MKSGFKRTIILLFSVILIATFIPSSVLAEEVAKFDALDKISTDTTTSPAISDTKIKLGKRMTWQLSVTGAEGTVLWSTSDKKIATVSSDGLVKAKKHIGKAVITATLEDGTELHCNVKVVKPSLSEKKVSVVAAFSTELRVANTTKEVKWSSSNTSIAKVNSKGKVTGRKAGTCTIFAKVDGYTLKCTVNVKANAYNYGKPKQGKYKDWGIAEEKVYYENGKIYIDAYVINNLGKSYTGRDRIITRLSWLDAVIDDENGDTIASNTFVGIKLYVRPGRMQKITLMFSGDDIKMKKYNFRKGKADIWLDTDDYIEN